MIDWEKVKTDVHRIGFQVFVVIRTLNDHTQDQRLVIRLLTDGRYQVELQRNQACALVSVAEWGNVIGAYGLATLGAEFVVTPEQLVSFARL